jgi:hypothetical protein
MICAALSFRPSSRNCRSRTWRSSVKSILNAGLIKGKLKNTPVMLTQEGKGRLNPRKGEHGPVQSGAAVALHGLITSFH